MSNSFSLSGARVIITGAASGIGRRMADFARARGAEVVGWDLRGSDIDVDVTDSAAVDAAVAASGPVDVLINNAGVVSGQRLLESSEAQIRRTFEVNVLAHFWTSRAVLPGMIERGRGKIVTIASAAALLGVARQTDYAASKWAAFGFAESLRAELRKDGSPISTLVVAPYFIDTGMFAGVRTKFPLLLPILQERDVARRVLDAIESGRQQLILPPFARLTPLLRVLPPIAFDAVTDFLGINQTMDEFTGRSPRQS
ncbi:MAG TPA: SDR family oxidoreductase [Microbacteriaceae bacterium]|nr:SDR family oxidoreductase [Microbacteriaceae bacterium]